MVVAVSQMLRLITTLGVMLPRISENATNLDSIKFYVDGVETGYASSSTTMPQTGDYLDVRLGNDHSDRRLNGSMDEAHVFPQSNDPQTGSRLPTIIKNQVPPL